MLLEFLEVAVLVSVKCFEVRVVEFALRFVLDATVVDLDCSDVVVPSAVLIAVLVLVRVQEPGCHWDFDVVKEEFFVKNVKFDAIFNDFV